MNIFLKHGHEFATKTLNISSNVTVNLALGMRKKENIFRNIWPMGATLILYHIHRKKIRLSK